MAGSDQNPELGLFDNKNYFLKLKVFKIQT